MVVFFDKYKWIAWSGPARTLILVALLLAPLLPGISQAVTAQRAFPSPEEAAKALITALRVNDVQELQAIFGPDREELVDSGDSVADRSRREKFVKLYEERNRLSPSGQGIELSVGNGDWPFPIPLVQKDGQWRFDTAAGKDEILARRIGENELSVIQFCLAFVDAQREYASKDRDGDGLLTYARKFRSDQGQHNGLYWENKEGEEQSPLGTLAAEAQKQGYTVEQEKPAPFFGYYYRILTGQGGNAPGGAYDYLVNGKMLGGFALVAYPAEYHSSGIMTFIVNHAGQVYQKDLGDKTEEAAQAVTLFDPDSSWQKVDEKVVAGGSGGS